jgi:hypothetical protein
VTLLLAALFAFELDELDFELAPLLQQTSTTLISANSPAILTHFFKT